MLLNISDIIRILKIVIYVVIKKKGEVTFICNRSRMEYSELINKLEQKRKVVVKRICFSIGFVALGLAVGWLINRDFGYAVGGIVGFIVAIVLISEGFDKYKKVFKNQFMPLVVNKTGLDLKYVHKQGIPKEVVMSSRLFKKPDRYIKEDFMYGTLDGVNFMSSDVHMQDKRVTRDSKGRRRVRYDTFFRGRWFVYEFNKSFNGIIQVREEFFKSHPWGLKVEKIKLEDVEFNRKFNTYATNQHDAFYVLTPTLMENIKKLERKFPGSIYFSFIENQLHIAIYHSKDSFEPPVFSKLDESLINELVSDIVVLQEIVNELKLNRKIFK